MYAPKGIIVPIVTPFDERGNVNYPVLRQLISRLLDAGVHGIFPLGTTGEFFSVSDEDYTRIAEESIAETAGRADICVGIGDIATRDAIRHAQLCEQIEGVQAISVLTPMFLSPTQDELYEHYLAIAKATQLPVIIYNNRPKTNATVTPETAARLAKIPNIVGIKDSTGDFTNTLEYLQLTSREDFSVMIGRDTLICSGLEAGASGAIASCANVAPELVVAIYEKMRAGDTAGAMAAQMALNPLRIACGMGTFPVAIKEALVMQGIPVGECLPPIRPLSAEQREKLRKVVSALPLGSAAGCTAK